MLRGLTRKAALITGGARGQGRAHAVRLAREGVDIAVLDVCRSAATTAYEGPSPGDLERTAAEVRALGRRCIALQVDVRDFYAVGSAVSTVVDELGRIDIVVANAGICSAALTWDLSLEQWRETIDTNLTGVFHVAKATIPTILAQGGGGSMVIVSSLAGLKGLPLMSHYVASKHGLVGLARSMANELGAHGIRVNTVHPGTVATRMTVPDLFELLDRHPHFADHYAGSLPDPASIPADVADAVAWLASDESRHVTGISLPVDLGAAAR